MSVPAQLISRMPSHTSLRLPGSRPVVGSSSSSSRGLPTRLAPRSRRRRMPPEYVLTNRSAASTRSICSRIRSAEATASARPWPYRRATITRFSRPLIISSTAADWPARPIMRRTAMGSRTTSWPPTSSVPRSGWISVATMRMNVVLPAPLGPRMATGCPAGSVRVSSVRAWTFPNFLDRPSARIRAWSLAWACMGAPPFVWVCCVQPARAARGEPTRRGRLRF